ncbi:MAG: hypothetical protein ACUVV0_14230 [Anaerolineae bacterium]
MSPSEQEKATPSEIERRRLNVVKYGLVVVTVVATILTFAFIMFLSSWMELAGELSLIKLALTYAAITLVVVGVACTIIYFIYKRLVVRS